MAKHTEIKVGDSDWVVRIGGDDVQVKVTDKVKKSSGRGYEFTVKRVLNGRMVGRALTRGSGALRRPGEAARSFGGGKSRNAPVTAVQAVAPAPRERAPKKTTPAPSRSQGFRPPAPSTKLASLRGRGRAVSVKPALLQRAPAKPKAEKPVYPSRLVERICKGLMKTNGGRRVGDTIPEVLTHFREVGDVVARLMAEHRSPHLF